MTQRFGAIGPSLHRAGWEVIPIKEKTKRPVVKGWQHGFDREQIEQFAANGYASGSIGLLARSFPGVDIDVADQACADAIEAAVLKVFGAAPVRYGAAPKRLCMYATNEPFTKVKVYLQAPDGSTQGPDGKDYAVEFLGDGQQYLIYGEHPDGFEYRWPGNDGPGNTDIWELTDITLNAVTRFVESIGDYLPDGWSVREHSAGNASSSSSSSAVTVDAFDHYRAPLEGWDADRIRAEIAPYLDLAMHYDDWIKVGMAIHHQFRGADEGCDLWDEIFQASPKYGGPEYGASLWKKFKTTRPTGAGPVTLASLVKQTRGARDAAAREQRGALLDELRAALAACTEPRDLQDQVAARVANTAELTDVEREMLAADIQLRAKDLGVKLPINTVRGWVRSRSSAGDGWAHLNEDGHPLCTLENMRVLVDRLGYVVRYNVIKKSIEIMVPGESFTRDNRDNAAIACVLSECEKARMPTKHVAQYLIKLADENPFNPVATWIESAPWDGVSRLEDFYATVQTDGDDTMKALLLRKWLVQAVAAAFAPDGIANQGVLTFIGEQNIGKTTWFQRLAPPELDAVLTGHTLDTRSKDSVLIALSFWLVELGEVDATMRKSDISALKSFVTQPLDKIRRPYAATESSFGRRTAFGATVNDEQFLHDPTGNRRFWSIAVTGFDLAHGIDMQQLWAEVLEIWRAGESWFLSRGEVGELNERNEEFTVADPNEERLATGLDWDSDEKGWDWVTATQALQRVGVRDPVRAQTIVAGRVLKRLTAGRRRKSNGRTLFLVPGAVSEFLG